MNWTEGKYLPLINDPEPNTVWDNWRAGQWDLYFIDSNGKYFTDFNINSWNYNQVYNTIMELVKGCTEPDACNYNADASFNSGCYFAQENYDCDGNCIIGLDCNGICGGSSVLDECNICDGSDNNGNQNCDIECANYDCLGVCEGNAILDECGVCNGPGPLGPDGTFNSNYNCEGECISVVDCEGNCGGVSLANFSCQNGDIVCNAIDCQELDLLDLVLPESHELISAYPNPFNPNTTISYSLVNSDNLRLLIIDLQGNVIEEIFEGFQSEGYHLINWNASKYPSGIYFILMKTSNTYHTQKIILIK